MFKADNDTGTGPIDGQLVGGSITNDMLEGSMANKTVEGDLVKVIQNGERMLMFIRPRIQTVQFVDR